MTLPTIETIFCAKRIVPVLVIEDLDNLLPLLDALATGGLTTVEITLRSPLALAAIELARQQRPALVVGAGTITSVDQMLAAHQAGAQFCVSPGFSANMVNTAASENILLLPGVSTPTEVMQALDCGVNTLKLFPAQPLAGVELLNAYAGPFANVQFCPTGGLNGDNAPGYLKINNVCSVAGSWMVPRRLLQAREWPQIVELARAAAEMSVIARSGD